MQQYNFTVNNDFLQYRIDVFLSLHLELSRSYIQKLIKEGNIKVNNTTITSSSLKLNLDDKVFLQVPEAKVYFAQPQKMDIDIIYEDDDVLVVNKDSKTVVHMGAGNKTDTLVNGLLYYAKGSLSSIGGVERPGIVHRIDKETSGLLLIAKNDLTHRSLGKQFEEHSITRKYRGLVYGILKEKKGRIENNIGRDQNNRIKMKVVKTGGRRAVTCYKVLQESQEFGLSLVEFILETGRTHQIRVHMSNMGHAIFGDKVYSKNKKIESLPEKLQQIAKQSNRHFLHAFLIGFMHPKTKKYLEISKEEPEEINLFYKQIFTKST